MDANAFPFSLIVEPGTNDMNVGCRLCDAFMYLTVAFVTCHSTLCVTGFAPLQCDLSMVVKLQAASNTD